MAKKKTDSKSSMGYRDDSPYRNEPYIDIDTQGTGVIDMSDTGKEIIAINENGESKVLPRYSGLHQMGTNKVREIDPEMLNRNKYNTSLSKKEKKKFDTWIKKESERQSRDILMDMGAYDIQGFWKSGDWKNIDSDNHGSDKWKKPNHPTFSEQSIYANENNRGGIWMADGAFHPSAETNKLYNKEYYDWMFGSEPHRPEYYGGALLPDVTVSPNKNKKINPAFNSFSSGGNLNTTDMDNNFEGGGEKGAASAGAGVGKVTPTYGELESSDKLKYLEIPGANKEKMMQWLDSGKSEPETLREAQLLAEAVGYTPEQSLVVASQWAFESGGGSHLSSPYNYFGIKSHSKGVQKRIKDKYGIEVGAGPTTKTAEFLGKGREVIDDSFMTFNNAIESFIGHKAFLETNQIYKKALNSKTAKGFAQGLEDAGYATVKNKKGERIYAEKLADFYSPMKKNPEYGTTRSKYWGNLKSDALTGKPSKANNQEPIVDNTSSTPQLETKAPETLPVVPESNFNTNDIQQRSADVNIPNETDMKLKKKSSDTSGITAPMQYPSQNPNFGQGSMFGQSNLFQNAGKKDKVPSHYPSEATVAAGAILDANPGNPMGMSQVMYNAPQVYGQHLYQGVKNMAGGTDKIVPGTEGMGRNGDAIQTADLTQYMINTRYGAWPLHKRTERHKKYDEIIDGLDPEWRKKNLPFSQNAEKNAFGGKGADAGNIYQNAGGLYSENSPYGNYYNSMAYDPNLNTDFSQDIGTLDFKPTESVNQGYQNKTDLAISDPRGGGGNSWNTVQNEDGSANVMNIAGAAMTAVGGIANAAQKEDQQVEDYVDVAQDTVAQVIPVAGLFHGISEMGQGIAGASMGAEDTKKAAQGKDLSRRLFEPHTLLTVDLMGKSEEQKWKEDPANQGYRGTADRSANLFKKGGFMNNIYANGSNMNVPTKEFNTGGTHAENSLGGIPQGVGSNGKVNRVEEGEKIFIDPRNNAEFVVTAREDRMAKPDKDILSKHHLPTKYANKSLISIFDDITRSKLDRKHDAISTNSINLELERAIDMHQEISDKLNKIDDMKDKMDGLVNSNIAQNGSNIYQNSKPGHLDVARPSGYPHRDDSLYFSPQGRKDMSYYDLSESKQNIADYISGVSESFNENTGTWEPSTHSQILGTSGSQVVSNSDWGKLMGSDVIGAGKGIKKTTVVNPATGKNVHIPRSATKTVSIPYTGESVLKQNGSNIYQNGVGDENRVFISPTEKRDDLIAQMKLDAREHDVVNQTNTDYWKNQPENKSKEWETIYGRDAIGELPGGKFSDRQKAHKKNLAEAFHSKYGQYPIGQTDHVRTTSHDLTNGANMYQNASYLDSLAYDPYLNPEFTQEGNVNLLPKKPLVSSIPPTFADIPVESRELEPHTDKIANQINDTSDLNLNVDLDQNQNEYTYQDKLGSSLAKYAPVAYNLAQGLFGKEDKRSKENYYDPINAPEYDISETRRELGRNYAAYLRNLTKTGYQTKALAGYQAKNEADARLNEKKENVDAANQFKADAANQQASYRAQITADQWNRMDDNQKREYLDTAMTQIGQIGSSSESNDLALLYANMMSPDFNLSKKGMFEDKFKNKKK